MTKNPKKSEAEEHPMAAKIDYDELRRLISFLEEKNLTAFELEMEGFRIKVDRSAPPAAAASPAPAASCAPAPGSSLDAAATQTTVREADRNLVYVTSPMVGTFYRAPDPASPAFVEIGEDVTKGQTLCIIEAMKLMNEIEVETDGVVVDIFVQNGRPVEFGQRLFAVKPLV